MISNGTTLANNKLDSEEISMGTAPLLRAYNGAVPASADAALSGNTLIALGTLPSDYLSNATNKVKSKLGTASVGSLVAAARSSFPKLPK